MTLCVYQNSRYYVHNLLGDKNILAQKINTDADS